MERENDNRSRRDKFQSELRNGVEYNSETNERKVSPIHTRINTKGLPAEERNRLNHISAELYRDLTYNEQKEEDRRMKQDMQDGYGYVDVTLRSIRRMRRIIAKELPKGRRERYLNKTRDLTYSKYSESSLYNSNYSDTKREIKRPTSKQQKFRGKMIAIAAAVAIAAGSVPLINNAYESYARDNEPVTLEQAEQRGITTEELKVNPGTLQEIQSLQAALEDENIDNVELKNIGNRLYNLQRDIIKSKLASDLNVDQSQISLHSDIDSETGSREYIEIKDSNDIKSNRVITEDQMPSEVVKYIQEVARTEANTRIVEGGKYDSEKTINAYKEVLGETTEFAAGDLEVEFETDENGNIINDENGNAKIKNVKYSQTRQSDLPNMSQENEQDEER